MRAGAHAVSGAITLALIGEGGRDGDAGRASGCADLAAAAASVGAHTGGCVRGHSVAGGIKGKALVCAWTHSACKHRQL